jgi:hypothetical protein
MVTSAGYLVIINFDGSFTPQQIYYTGTGCTGTAYLNAAAAAGGKICGKYVVYSGSMGQLMAPADIVGGLAVSESLTAAGLDNPTCSASSGTQSGWQLAAVTRATIGLPATIVSPLKLQ